MPAALPRFDAGSSVEEVTAAVREHGAAVVESLAPPELLDRVATELAPWIAATPPGTDDFSGQNTRRTGALLARSPAAHALIAHPLVLGVVDAVLWPQKTTYQLHLTQAIAIGPGSEDQVLHRDQWCFDFFPFPDDVEVEVATIWALTDFTEENGATRVVPGSHRRGADLGLDLRSFEPDAVQAVMPRGSVVIYSGRTAHAGSANRTTDDRIGINVDYVLGWLRQEENQYLVAPPEVARDLPEELQRLAGYSMGAYALGYVDDLRDPIEVLHDGATTGPTFAPRPN